MSETKAKKVWPEGTGNQFRDFLDRTKSLGDLLSISKAGISGLRAQPKVLEALKMVDEFDRGEGSGESSYQKELEHAQNIAKLSQSEIDNDFPLLNSQALVTTWSFLEGMLKSLACFLIKNDVSFREKEEFKKIKISIFEYEELNEDERVFYLFDTYEKNVTQGIPYGAKRFEELLKPFGLAGPLNARICDGLHEVAQIRNCLVHRHGLADRQLLQKCPNLSVELGKQIKITSKEYHRYFNIIHEYVVLLICRLGFTKGIDMSSSVPPDLAEDYKKHYKI